MENQIVNQPNNKPMKVDLKNSRYATGRRKRSIAKVWLKKGSGNILVNGKKMIEYFKKQNLQIAVFRQLTLVKRENDFDVKWLVKGVTKGIGDYGNAFGIPIVGGEVFFDDCYWWFI